MATSKDPFFNQHVGDVHVGEGAQVYIGAFGSQEHDETTQSTNQKIRVCRLALFLTDPEVDRASLMSIKGKRVPRTCEWILENQIYEKWSRGDTDTQLLSICGGPGQGKTMLAIFLSQELQKDRDAIYYFCSSGDEMRNSARCILRGLLWQMLGVRPSVWKLLWLDLEDPAMGKSSVNNREWLWRMFVRLCTHPDMGALFCVLDGLDECDRDSSTWLATNLLDFLGPGASHNTSVKMVVISREFLGLRNIPKLHLNPDNNDLIRLDLQRFVAARVTELSGLPGFTSKFGDAIKTELLTRAEGRFLWVGFAMAELLKKQTLSQIEATMAVLPKGLPEIYARMLHQIEPEYTDTSMRIFRWLALAIRPLSREELIQVLGLHASPMLSAQQVLSACLHHCGPFISEQNETDKPSLIHQSAKDYLLRPDVDEDPYLESFRIKAEQAHCSIARECLDRIMSGSDEIRSACVHQKGSERIKLPWTIDLLGYAVQYWSEHARCASDYAEELLTHPSGIFDKSSSLFEDLTCFRASDEPGSALEFSCYHGIAPWTEKILRRKTHAVAVRTFRWLKLHYTTVSYCLGYAVEQNRINVAKLLLSRGARVNADYGLYSDMKVIHLASRHVCEDMVRLLLDCGAEVSSRDRDRQTALHIAAWNKAEAVVRLLLDRGVDVAAKDKDGRTALHNAASTGAEAVVRLLLGRGADVASAAKDGQTVLHRAARSGSANVVRLLLDHNANIASTDTEGQTALHHAALTGSDAVVRLLLDRGADVNPVGYGGYTVLHNAAWKGSEAIVDMLLARGADVTVQTSEGQTALHFAARSGTKGVVSLLLRYGADPTLPDNRGRTALGEACKSRSEAAVDLLDAAAVSRIFPPVPSWKSELIAQYVDKPRWKHSSSRKQVTLAHDLPIVERSQTEGIPIEV